MQLQLDVELEVDAVRLGCLALSALPVPDLFALPLQAPPTPLQSCVPWVSSAKEARVLAVHAQPAGTVGSGVL